MAEVRRERRWIESVDPATGQTVYRDESTGELYVPDASGAPPAPVPPAPVQPTQVTERAVTQQGPTNGQVYSQRTVTGPAAPTGLRTQETQVYTDDPYEPKRVRSFKVEQAIYLVFGILEALLAIRFVLKLLGANPQSGFASFIYGITAPFMAPFANVFGQPAVSGSVIEINTIVAIVVYALIAWVLVKLAWLIGGETRSGVRTSQVSRRVDR